MLRNISIFFIYSSVLLVAEYVMGDEVFLACSSSEDNYWYQPLTSTGNPIVVSGHYVKNNKLKFFFLTQEEVFRIKDYCHLGADLYPMEDDAINTEFRFAALIKPKNNGSLYVMPVRSDQKLKTAIEPIADPLGNLSMLEGYRYQVVDKEGLEYGLIAQQVQLVFPELVSTSDQGYLQLDYRGLIPILIEAIKELKTRIEALEKKIEDK